LIWQPLQHDDCLVVLRHTPPAKATDGVNQLLAYPATDVQAGRVYVSRLADNPEFVAAL
jgi:hypothetical protein